VLDVTGMQRPKCQRTDVSAAGHFLLHVKARKRKPNILLTVVNGRSHKTVDGEIEGLWLIDCMVYRIFNNTFNVGSAWRRVSDG
jgi:hypothetical protein